MWFRRAPGVRLEPLGGGWAAYSGLSGETHLLNDESVAVIEALSEHSATHKDEVVRSVAQVWSTDPESITEHLQQAWSALVAAGLISLESDRQADRQDV